MHPTIRRPGQWHAKWCGAFAVSDPCSMPCKSCSDVQENGKKIGSPQREVGRQQAGPRGSEIGTHLQRPGTWRAHLAGPQRIAAPHLHPGRSWKGHARIGPPLLAELQISSAPPMQSSLHEQRPRLPDCMGLISKHLAEASKHQANVARGEPCQEMLPCL